MRALLIAVLLLGAVSTEAQARTPPVVDINTWGNIMEVHITSGENMPAGHATAADSICLDLPWQMVPVWDAAAHAFSFAFSVANKSALGDSALLEMDECYLGDQAPYTALGAPCLNCPNTLALAVFNGAEVEGGVTAKTGALRYVKIKIKNYDSTALPYDLLVQIQGRAPY